MLLVRESGDKAYPHEPLLRLQACRTQGAERRICGPLQQEANNKHRCKHQESVASSGRFCRTLPLRVVLQRSTDGYQETDKKLQDART